MIALGRALLLILTAFKPHHPAPPADPAAEVGSGMVSDAARTRFLQKTDSVRRLAEKVCRRISDAPGHLP